MPPSDLSAYESSYLDLVVVGQSARGPIALVAGSHTAEFPYPTTAPWDNCLLLVGNEGYAFTGRVPGEALHINFDEGAERASGTIRFHGSMRRRTSEPPGEPPGESLGEAAGAVAVSTLSGEVRVELELPIAFVRFPARSLGGEYNVLRLPHLPGMDWTPWDLSGDAGTLRIDGHEVAITGLHGAAERGQLTNLRAPLLAIKYDYLSVARPGPGGYARVAFTSHALHPGGLFGRFVDWYLTASASASLTSENGRLSDGNPHGVEVPPAGNEAVLFEDVVDLGDAQLQRQMVHTVDASGATLYGLREIFTATPGARIGRRPALHLNARQVSALLVFLVALDVVLATVALGFPDLWTHIFNGLPYHSTFGILERTGATWMAFALLQGLALFHWRSQPYWLPLVAGVRLTEIFSDWATLLASHFSAEHLTTFSYLAFFLAPPANLLFGLLLIGTYKKLQSGPPGDGPLLQSPWTR